MQIILAAALLLQAAPTQAERIEAALKKMTDREYRMVGSEGEIGTMTFKQRIETEGGRKVAVLEFVARMTRDGKTEEGTMSVKADLDGLRFLSMKSVDPSGKAGPALEVKDGKVEVKTLGGVAKSIDVTSTTVLEMSLLRLPGVLEQKVGSTLKVDVLDLSSMNKDYELKCLERTTLELAGTKHDAFKWRLTGKSQLDLPSGPEVFKVTYNFWVNPEGVLLRYAMSVDDRAEENVLELKAK